MKKLVDVYAYRNTLHGVQLLILRRSANTIYEGQWRMIGGKVHTNEHRVDAALRELNEETGLYPNKLWTLPSVNHFYEAHTDTLHIIPAFAAELPADGKPKLNHEHNAYEWVLVENLPS